VTVLGPGDFQVSHEQDPDDDEEDLDSMDLQKLVLMPPDVQLIPYHLNLCLYRAEGLPAQGCTSLCQQSCLQAG